MNQETQNHWNGVYARGDEQKKGWYRPRLDTSLRLIAHAGCADRCHVIDVGGGNSRLVDDLLTAGLTVTVLDIAEAALAITQERLGADASRASWLVGDVLSVGLCDAQYDLWHDRAVFHFLAQPAQRATYLEKAQAAIKPGGSLVMGAFSPEAPPKCSGLDVVRYSPEALYSQMGTAFEMIESASEEHITPGGVVQPYTYGRFIRR